MRSPKNSATKVHIMASSSERSKLILRINQRAETEKASNKARERKSPPHFGNSTTKRGERERESETRPGEQLKLYSKASSEHSYPFKYFTQAHPT